MSKTNAEKLASFKKANKTARQRMAINAGFKNVDDYQAFLEGSSKQTKSNSAPETKPVIHTVSILDASSSMHGGKFNNALEGINKEFAELAANEEIQYYGTFVAFSYSSVIKNLFVKQDVKTIRPAYPSAGGMTALFDAIGETLTQVIKQHKKGEKVLVNIFTDGEENDSRKWNASKVQELVKECENMGFTITFVGTSRDVEQMKATLSIHDSNTLVHQNTAASVQASFQTRSAATKLYSSKVLKGEDVSMGFYKSNEKL